MTYTIGDVSKKLNIPISTIRYYDKQGLLPFVKRNEAGLRQFSHQDLDILYYINCFKTAEMPIKEIKRYFDLYAQGESTLQERYDLIHAHERALEKKIQQLQQAQIVLAQKASSYQKDIKTKSI